MFQNYFNAIQTQYLSDNGSSELSYRTFLQNLLDSFTKEFIGNKLKINHETSVQSDKGRPDFKITTTEKLTIGLIETKRIGEDLKKILNSKQLQHYKKLSDNIIVTDYLEFYLIRNGESVLNVNLFFENDLQNKRFKLEQTKIEEIKQLLKTFFESEPAPIYKTQDLALRLSEKVLILKEFSYNELITEKSEPGKLEGLFEAFKLTLLPLLEKKYFADIYAQTITYGLFLSALNCNDPKIELDIDSAYKHLPSSFSLIRELFHSIEDFPYQIVWAINEVINILKVTDFSAIKHEFAEYRLKGKGFDDPFIFFYEDFLKHYDKEQRELKGVYYTPESVVSFIVRSIESILKEVFNINDGLINKDVTVLDFATGTGTFLLHTFKLALEEARKLGDRRIVNKLLNEQLIDNFYGFELLVAPYVVAHLKISEFFKEQNLILDTGKRIKVYLTNTLTKKEPQHFSIMQSLSNEGKEANRIKNKDILIILGNPPYSIHSENTDELFMKLLEDYKPSDEKKLNIDDDYIKFIRFANWKMENVERGIIGIITNHSFINGLIHRKMRGKLINDFDEIYILNLHGNSRINEKCPDGSKDENIFDIMQGVAISLFIKKNKNKNKNCKVYYEDLWGLKDYKYDFLDNHIYNKIPYTHLNITEFNEKFRNTRWGKKRFIDDLNFFAPKQINHIKEYGEFWGLTEAFKIYGSGIKTDRDNLVIDFDVNKLELKLKEAILGNYNEYFKKKYSIHDSSSYKFVQKLKSLKFYENDIIDINYRPFDIRKEYYKIGFTSRPAAKVNKNVLLNNNLIFSRIWDIKLDWSGCFITNKSIDVHFIGGQSYISPLNIYQNHGNSDKNGNDFLFNEEGKKDNFTKEFRKYFKLKYQNKYTPEQILGYIYAIMFSHSYRTKYIEFLKIDYPRIPFSDDEALFKELSEIGSELIEHHLLNISYSENICKIHGTGDNFKVEKVEYFQKEYKVNINKDRYFQPVLPEIWNFHIGGYQVLDKWLKERKKHEVILSIEEIKHFIKVVNVLDFTIKTMKKIDELTKEWI